MLTSAQSHSHQSNETNFQIQHALQNIPTEFQSIWPLAANSQKYVYAPFLNNILLRFLFRLMLLEPYQEKFVSRLKF